MLTFCRLRVFVLALVACLTTSVLAGLAPENVAVVVNGNSWASLTVANEYRRLRRIPACNFIVLTGLSSIETTNVEQFRREILGPVFAAFEKRGLTKQIDCIAYSVDIPYAVDVTGDMAGKKFPLVITGTASTNGLTYLHEWVEKKDTDYLRLDINRYNRRTLPLPKGAALSPAETAEMARGLDLYEQKKYAESAEILSKLLGVQRSDPDIAYDLACSYSLAGKPNEAVSALQKAVETGWRNAVQTTSDPDLKSIASRDDFKTLVDKMKAMPMKVQPGVGFRSQTAWGQNGEAAAAGPHYMLSTMLGVTCGRGNSVNEVLLSLRRSATADGTSPKGTVYFPENGDVRSTTRAWAFRAAADELKQLGVNSVVESGVLPVNRADVAGAMIGISDFDWNGSKSTILKGAIVEHFTSFGGIISERSGQTPCTDFIRAGASGTSGTVTEPYALQQKFPTAFMQVEYCSGSTLAKSYYESLFGPYQLLVIGDPLCKPWSKTVHVTSTGIVKKGVILKGTINQTPDVSSAERSSIASYEMYLDGKLVTAVKPGRALLTETTKLGDGFHTLSTVAVQNNAPAARTDFTVPVTVNNHGRNLTAKAPVSNSVNDGDSIGVEVRCPGATSIEILHLGRRVGQIQGPKGLIQIPIAMLGLGWAELRPVAHLSSGDVFGEPIDMSNQPSSPYTLGSSSEDNKQVSGGLELRVDGGTPTVVKDTIDSAWLSNLVKGPSKHFTLSGMFEVSKEDLYQLQLKTNTGAAVKIDGERILGAIDERQLFAPVQLQPGRHRIEVIGIAPAIPTLDIRFGLAGVQHLAETQFQHVVG